MKTFRTSSATAVSLCTWESFFFEKFKLLEIWSKQPLELSLIQILLEVNLPVIVFPTGD